MIWSLGLKCHFAFKEKGRTHSSVGQWDRNSPAWLRVKPGPSSRLGDRLESLRKPHTPPGAPPPAHSTPQHFSRKHERLGPPRRNAPSNACGHLSHHGPKLEATRTLSTRRAPRLGCGHTRLQNQPGEGTVSWHADSVGGSQRHPDERETRDTHTRTPCEPRALRRHGS